VHGQRPMQPDGNTAKLGEAEHATVQHGAVAILRIGAGVLEC
jgi:hypothetical protein